MITATPRLRELVNNMVNQSAQQVPALQPQAAQPAMSQMPPQAQASLPPQAMPQGLPPQAIAHMPFGGVVQQAQRQMHPPMPQQAQPQHMMQQPTGHPMGRAPMANRWLGARQPRDY